MKKIIALLFVLSLLSTPAFALMCEQSQANGGSDACWTQVTLRSNETTLVSAGSVLVADTTSGTALANTGSYQVRVPTASSDGVRVMGVAQGPITSGSTAMVLVRGKGKIKIKTTETITSGDALFVSTSADASTVTSTTQRQLAFALETSAASGNTFTTKDAYITIV